METKGIRVALDGALPQIFNIFRGDWQESMKSLQMNPAGHGEYRSHGDTVDRGL